MAKPEQLLIIDPQGELQFKGPSASSPVTSYIKLTNPTNKKIYFKIKTTAPKRYCVRPNSGVLRSKEVIEIAVCLQPCEFNDLMEKNKHKFMVQSVIAPDGDTDDCIAEVWKDAYPEKIMDYKLKCVFDFPSATASSTEPAASTSAAKSETNTINGKSKRMEDALKTSSKSMDENEEKLLKADHEVHLLRVEESKLRQENLQIKEELLKLRNAVEKNATSGRLTSSPTEYNMYQPSSISTVAIAMAVVAVLVGYFLGKMI